MIAPIEIKEHIFYDPLTGLIKWKINKKNQYMQREFAGSTNHQGRPIICILGKNYLLHRVAWVYMKGEWPKFQIDHIDGNRKNNKWENLRLATPSQNRQNLKKAMSNNVSGYLGVSFRKDINKYRARIRLNGKLTNLGNFSNPEDAHQAYLNAKRVMHEYCTI